MVHISSDNRGDKIDWEDLENLIQNKQILEKSRKINWYLDFFIHIIFLYKKECNEKNTNINKIIIKNSLTS